MAIGRALGERLAARDQTARVIIGQDTRESGAWISAALAAGLESAKVQVVSAGVITTPGIAYLTRFNKFSAGIVISASHNPWQDNGIKVFGADGYKLSDELEHAIEADIFAHIEQLAESASHNVVPASEMLPGDGKLREQYAQWLADFVAGVDFSRLRVLVDCANGAASTIAPLVFRDCGISADYLHVEPNGRNINAGCGALHPEHVAQAVAASNGKYELGITFDGDADRALFSDAAGRVINGDAILLLAARDMKTRGHSEGRHGGGDDHVEHGTGSGAEAQRHRHAARARRRQVRAGADAQDRRDAGWRAVGTHPLSRYRHDDRRRHPHRDCASWR